MRNSERTQTRFKLVNFLSQVMHNFCFRLDCALKRQFTQFEHRFGWLRTRSLQHQQRQQDCNWRVNSSSAVVVAPLFCHQLPWVVVALHRLSCRLRHLVCWALCKRCGMMMAGLLASLSTFCHLWRGVDVTQWTCLTWSGCVRARVDFWRIIFPARFVGGLLLAFNGLTVYQ